MQDQSRADPVALSRTSSALAGLLAAATAVVAGELTGQLLPGAASPLLSVGNVVVSLVPPGLRDAAIDALGTADKPVLVGGVLVVITALGLAAGLVARRLLASAYAVAVLLALFAGLAVLAQPRSSAAGALGVAVVLAGTGVGALRLLLGDRLPAHGPLPGPAAPARRLFLARAGVLGLVVVAGGAVSRLLATRVDVERIRAALRLPPPARPAPGDLTAAAFDVPGLSPVITPNDAFYRIDTALVVPRVDISTWSLQVVGMVDRPLTLTYADLLAMRQYEADITLQCVSNEVGGDLVGNARWQGVLLSDVLALVGVHAGADQLVGRSVDDFTAGFPTALALDGRPAMIALGMNGEPLPQQHGFPARLVIPGLYGYISATKWLARLELTTLAGFDGYWVPRGWSKLGPIKVASRIDVPRDFGRVSAGPVVVAGVAWAPGPRRGIVRVQVRVDGGAWRDAELAGALGQDAWRQWKWTWPATAGQHRLEVRATDRTGTVQDAVVRDVRPDGATGYHAIEVLVT